MSSDATVRNMSERAGTTPPVPVTGEPLALELVNTTFIDGGLRGHLVDALCTPAHLDEWMTNHLEWFSPDLQPLASGAVCDQDALDRFLELRSALRACLTTVTLGNALDLAATMIVNRFAAKGAFRLELIPGETVTVRRRWPTNDPCTIALAEIATDACAVLLPDRIGKIKVCPAPGCILFFEKSHPRREWCSPACGNRVRVARHTRTANQSHITTATGKPESGL